MDDVEYDLAEIDFVEAVSAAGLAYADSLLSESRFSFERDRLVGAVLIASHARTPDLSRNTWRELINSGRIGLLRSAETRAALAQYDRTVSEQEGFWSIAGYGLSNWAEARIPRRVKKVFDVACGDSPDPMWTRRLIACPFDRGDWSDDQLRRDLETTEARLLLTLYTNRHGSAIDILEGLRVAARELQESLRRASP